MATSPEQASHAKTRRHRWTTLEYHRMGELGFFIDRRVELLDGDILQMSPQNAEHFHCLILLCRVLEEVFGENYWVRPQGPLALGPRSEPEPDVSVVTGHLSDYHSQHPTTALLVVEVSLSSLRLDRGKKARIYAAAGIPDYWVVDLAARTVQIHRDPGPIEEAGKGARTGYRTVTQLGLDATVSPLAKPEAVFEVRRLFG